MQARMQLAARPPGGYGSIARFWATPALRGAAPGSDAAHQVGLTTRWFRLTTSVRLGDVTLNAESLIDGGGKSGNDASRVVRRSWLAS